MKRIPPMWTWKPAWFRKLALPIYLLLWAAWQLLGFVLLLIVAAADGILQRVGELQGWSTALVWCRATWRGEHVGRALMAHYENLHEERNP